MPQIEHRKTRLARSITTRDPLSPSERSARMAKVRSTGNRSTELAVELALRRERIHGWRKHPIAVPGRPDFYFSKYRLAVFVNGCFWHACSRCSRRLPTARSDFWKAKIDANRRRDARILRLLRTRGFRTMRIWEHEVTYGDWIKRLRKVISLRR